MWFKNGLKAQKLLAQGNTLGINSNQQGALYGQKPCKLTSSLKLLPLQGDKFASIITQGAALGWELLPFQGVWGLLANVNNITKYEK